MFLARLRKRIALSLCLTVFAALLGSVEVSAQKKGGGTPPPPAPGTIYFLNTSTGSYWNMKGDGTGKAASIGRQPSSLKHGGTRWFLQDRTVADGSDQWFAATESGVSTQLTSDPTIPITGYPPVWSKDDSFFSFSALYQTDTEWIGVLYVVPLDWSTGTPVPMALLDVAEIRRPVYDEYGNYTFDDEEAAIEAHDWSPAGNAVAVTRWVWGVGYQIDVMTFSADGVADRVLTKGADPAWSPDGSRIAYNRHILSGYNDYADIWTVAPDGSGAVQLTQYVSTKSSVTSQFFPSWSPDGAFLAYTESVVSSNKFTYNLRRLGGGRTVILTTDGVSSWPRWRP
jgi:Tol biopolymer transport system component